MRTRLQLEYYKDSEDLAPRPNSGICLVPLDLLYAHMYPFHNECRAVGRIIQAGLNGKVAVRCHGYLTVSAAMEEGLEQHFHIAA